MKIKVKEKSYEDVMALEPYRNKRPGSQGRFWRWLLKTLSSGELKKVGFELETVGMERLGADEPALYLMNHSSFLDLKIASYIIYPRPFHIVCTLDGFVGKEGLMRRIGCIPTRKFMADTSLVRDLMHTAGTLKESILLYPEASYTFDGTATPLPASIGKLIKLLKVPVVMIRTFGAFQRDPLYNNLQLREVRVRAEMKYLLSPDDIAAKGKEELNNIIAGEFSFDNFRWQRENNVIVNEPFRADSLERVLYKCPACGAEGSTEGKGIHLTCSACGKSYELTELGYMRATAANGAVHETEPETEIPHIPDWYSWERDCVRKEIMSGDYLMEAEVDIIALINTEAVYKVGSGVLRHDKDGFHLTGCGGLLEYHQPPEDSYSLYSDYFWYEIGDMVSIGTPKVQYYCFPRVGAAAADETGRSGFLVAKARLAAEELYKMRHR